MDTVTRTKIMAELHAQSLLPWQAKIMETGEVQIIKEPSLGLVMMRAKESVERQVFNVGEILITECTVSVDGELGFAATLGNEEEKAKAMALIDAVFRTGISKWEPFIEEFTAWLAIELEYQHQEQLKEFRLMEKSRVDFEVMDE